jgi:hypothetical protein
MTEIQVHKFVSENWNSLLTLFLALAAIITPCIIFKKGREGNDRQHKLSTAPSFQHDTEFIPKEENKGLYITNIGNGVAVNVAIENISLYNPKEYIKFDPIDRIKPDEKVRVHFKVFDKNNKEVPNMLLEFWMFEKDNNSCKFDIVFNFQDNVGNTYKQTNRVGKDENHQGLVELL